MDLITAQYAVNKFVVTVKTNPNPVHLLQTLYYQSHVYADFEGHMNTSKYAKPSDREITYFLLQI